MLCSAVNRVIYIFYHTLLVLFTINTNFKTYMYIIFYQSCVESFVYKNTNKNTQTKTTTLKPYYYLYIWYLIFKVPMSIYYFIHFSWFLAQLLYNTKVWPQMVALNSGFTVFCFDNACTVQNTEVFVSGTFRDIILHGEDHTSWSSYYKGVIILHV